MVDGDKEFDRMMQLLDIGLAALKRGDGDMTLMALRETEKVARSLPTKVICLPDRSDETP